MFKKIPGIAFAVITMCFWLLCTDASAQKFVRYIRVEDLGTKTLYADSVLTSIEMPRGVARLANYPKFNLAALELLQVLQDPDKELLQVWVCGSASPDGLWGDNVRLSQARTDAAAAYLQDVLGVPEYRIHKESLNEDWNRLEELVEESDIPYKYEVIHIIRTKTWGERKTALQNLDGGKAWKMLERDFFPKLRCVRFAIYCKWDPTKPYLTEPKEEVIEVEPVKEVEKVDTVYVRDTVVIMKETVYMNPVEPEKKTTSERKIYDTPWLAAIKTDLATAAVALPQFGMEIQLSERLSLEMMGWYSEWAYINPCDDYKVYGFRPDLRFWTDGAMGRGGFVGLHANIAWYSMMINGTDFYQNASLCRDNFCDKSHFFSYEYKDEEDKTRINHYHDTPAWSLGVTLGYALTLDKKAKWALEFVAGLGYAHYEHNQYVKSQPWRLVTVESPESKDYIGLTRLGVNLSYRFSLRPYRK